LKNYSYYTFLSKNLSKSELIDSKILYQNSNIIHQKFCWDGRMQDVKFMCGLFTVLALWHGGANFLYGTENRAYRLVCIIIALQPTESNKLKVQKVRFTVAFYVSCNYNLAKRRHLQKPPALFIAKVKPSLSTEVKNI